VTSVSSDTTVLSTHLSTMEKTVSVTLADKKYLYDDTTGFQRLVIPAPTVLEGLLMETFGLQLSLIGMNHRLVKCCMAGSCVAGLYRRLSDV